MSRSKKNRKQKQSRKQFPGNIAVVEQQRVSKLMSQANNETIVPEYYREKKVSHFSIPVIMKQQRGYTYYSGEMSLAQLASLTRVDNYDGAAAGIPGKIQRANTEANGKKFGIFINDEENVCFGEILLNDRDGKFARFTSLREMGVRISQNKKLEATVGILRIPSAAKLWVYDGQTRRFGYLSLLHYDIELMATEVFRGYKNLNVPFCLAQVSPYEELNLFLNHNKQTTVPGEHKAIVSYHAHKDVCHVKNQTPAEAKWSVIAGALHKMVTDRTNPWYKMIIMPDTPDKTGLTGTCGSFHTGLKTFVGWLNKHYWSPETTNRERCDDLATICTTFWRAIKKTCPKIWKNPEDYEMARPKGISSLSLLIHVMFIDFFNTDTEWTIENIRPELKKSKIITTPKSWAMGGEISKRGGNYKALEKLQIDIYMQMKRR